MRSTTAITSALVSLVVASCGRNHVTPNNIPAFLLTFDGPRSQCIIKYTEASQAETIPCNEVVSHLQAASVPQASYFDVATIPNVNEAEYDAVMFALRRVGYQLTPGVHVGFLTEPDPKYFDRSPQNQ